MRRNNYNVIAGTGIIIAVIFFIYRYYPTLNIDASVATTLFTILAPLIMTTICIYVAAETSGAGRLGGMMGLGISLCFLLNSLNIAGLITAAMLNGLTMAQVQIWIIVLSTIIGAVLYGTN